MDNPYEAVIPDPVPDQAADNPYLNIVPSVDPREQVLRQSMQAAIRNNPDGFAKAYKVAKAAGVPLPIVSVDEPGWQQKVDFNAIDFKKINEHPDLQEWLADYNHASIAHDSLDPLAFAAGEATRLKEGKTYGAIGSVAAGVKSGLIYDVHKRASLAAYGVGMNTAADVAQTIAAARREQAAIQARMPEDVRQYQQIQQERRADYTRKQEFIDSLDLGAAEIPVKASVWATQFLRGTWEMLTNIGSGSVTVEAQNQAGSLPATAAATATGVGVGIASGPAGVVTGPVAAGGTYLLAGSALEYGAWMEQEIEKRVVAAGGSMTDPAAIEQVLNDPAVINEISRQAALKGVGTAAVDALMMGIGGKLITGAGSGIAAKAGAGAAEMGLQVAGGAASEVVGQGLALGWDGIDWNDVMDEAIGEVFGGGVDVAASSAVHLSASPRRQAVQLVKETVAAQQGWNAAQAMDQVVQTIKGTPLQQRNPEMTAALMQKLGGDRPVYFQVGDWDKAAASIGQNPAMLMERLTGDATAYSTAKAADAEIQVPLGKLLELMVSVDNHQAFLQPARVHEMSAAQAKEFAQGADKRLKQIEKDHEKLTAEVNKLLDEAAAEDKAEQETGAPAPEARPATEESFKTAVRKQVEAQLRRAGMDAMEARTAAAWFTAMNATRLRRSGLAPEQVMQMLPDIIGQGRVDGMDVALDRIRSGKLPTDREVYGTPLVEWLVKQGGLRDEGGELRAMDARLSRPGLVNNQGLSLDDAAQRAARAGYLAVREESYSEDSGTPNALLNALRDELSGAPAYSVMEENVDLLALREELLAIEREVQAAGLDIKTASNEEIKRALEKRGQEGLEQPNGGGQSGGFRPADNLLTLFRARDRSTFFHETAHWYLETQQQVVDAVRAMDPATLTADQQGVLADWEKLLAWLGVDEATWRGMDIEARRPFHEKMAAATEGYMMEGRAPSKELRGVFARVAGWLAAIYKSLRDIIARARAPEFQLDDDIRGILDRVLATDQEIAEARAVVDTALPDETPEVAKLREEARQEAEAELRAEIMQEISRENRKAMLAARKAIEPQVRDEVAAEPVYRAIDAMQGKVEGIEGFKLDLESLRSLYGGSQVFERLKKLRVTTSDGGVDANSAALLLGFRSGDDLVMALANAEDRKARIRRLTEERIAQRFPSLLADKGAISEAAMKAVHNERRSELLMREIELLAGKVQQATKDAQAPAKDAALRAAQESRRLMKQQAERFIAGRTIRSINPNTYLRAERRAMQAAVEAAAAGKFDEALRQKRRQLLNAELYRAAVAAVTGADKIKRYMTGVQSEGTQQVLGKAGQDYLDRADAILEGLEFKEISGTAAERRQRLAAWLAKQPKEDINPPADAALIDRLSREARTINYRDLSWSALQEARDAMQAIVQQARMKDRFLKNRKLRELADARIKIVGAIEEHVPQMPPAKVEAERTRLDKWAAKLRSFGAAMRMISSWARQADGGKAGGWVWEYLVRPLNEAADAEVQMRKEAAQRLKDYSDAWAKAGRKLSDRVMIPAIGQSLTLESRIMVALNWGNADNRQRVMDGHGWDEQQVRAILDTLEREDWVFVQSVWDQINSYWPQIAAKERRVTGIVPEKVEAEPVQTRFGEFAGGYFPIIYDPAMAAVSAEKDAEAAAKLYFLGDATRASTKRNHVLERGAGLGKPLRLSLDVVPQHVSQVIHDLTHHETVIDMNRVLGDEAIRDAIFSRLGPAALSEMRTLVKNVAMSDLVEGPVERAIRYLRAGASIATMGFSLSTVMMQVTGVGQSMQLVGVRPFAAAVAKLFSDPRRTENARKWINSKSRFMANREATVLREAQEVMNQVRGQAWKQNTTQWAYFLMLKAQGAVDAPTWLAAYDNAIKAGRAEDDAVAMADQAVIDTQGSGMMKDLSGVQRGRVTQLFTVYYSYFNVTYNRTAESVAQFRREGGVKSPAAIAHLAADMLLLYSLPAVLAVGARVLMGTDDDEEDFGTALAKEHLSVAMGTVFGVRELSGALVNDYGYRGPAGAMAFSTASKLIIEAKQGELDDGLAKAATQTVGVWAHLPVTPVVRLIDGMAYLDENPQGDARALLFGSPPK